MKVLGCTGGIGSGKSYVSNIFNKMGVPLYCSDEMAKKLYDTDESLRGALLSLLGRDIMKDGVIQREAMARKIFSSADLLQKTEELVHPAVMRDFERWKEKWRGSDFVIMESAIILQKPLVRRAADRILLVTAPEELRIERVIRRDNTTREAVLKRMAAQMTDEKMRAMADFTIFAGENEGNVLFPSVFPYKTNTCIS